MTIKEYQNEAVKTAIYPESSKIIYPLLGLVGELGELIEKATSKSLDDEALKKEIGDVMWYLVVFSRDLGFDLDLLYPNYEVSTSELLLYLGKISEQVKKNIRDGRGIDEFVIQNGLSFVYSYLVGFCRMNRFSLEDIMIQNIAKLKSRQERGVIQGSGDNR